MLQTAYIRTQGQRHAANSQYQRSKTKDMLETSTAYVRNTGTKTCCRQAASEKQGQNVLQTAYKRNRAKNVADSLHQ